MMEHNLVACTKVWLDDDDDESFIALHLGDGRRGVRILIPFSLLSFHGALWDYPVSTYCIGFLFWFQYLL